MNYTEDVLDYDALRFDLVLQRVKDVTKDKISFKETLKNLEICALHKMSIPNEYEIDGIEIEERPEIHSANYNKLPAYADWKKKID